MAVNNFFQLTDKFAMAAGLVFHFHGALGNRERRAVMLDLQQRPDQQRDFVDLLGIFVVNREDNRLRFLGTLQPQQRPRVGLAHGLAAVGLLGKGLYHLQRVGRVSIQQQ